MLNVHEAGFFRKIQHVEEIFKKSQVWSMLDGVYKDSREPTRGTDTHWLLPTVGGKRCLLDRGAGAVAMHCPT